MDLVLNPMANISFFMTGIDSSTGLADYTSFTIVKQTIGVILHTGTVERCPRYGFGTKSDGKHFFLYDLD